MNKALKEVESVVDRLLKEKLSDPKNLPCILNLVEAYLIDLAYLSTDAREKGMLFRCSEAVSAASQHIAKETTEG